MSCLLQRQSCLNLEEKREMSLCYVPSLLRSMLTSVSMVLKDKNALLSLFSVLSLRSLSWGFCLSWKTKEFGCLMGAWFLPSVLTRVQVCTHMRCVVSCHPSLWVKSHSSLFVSDSAQSTPLTVYPLKGGQRQGTGSWVRPFFMIGSRPANYVK